MYLSINIDIPDGAGDAYDALAQTADRVEAAKADFAILARAHGDQGLAPPRIEPVVSLPWIAGRLRTPLVVAAIPALHSVPFHIARALSAADFLTDGRCGWLPLLAGGARFDAAYGVAQPLSGGEALAKYDDFIRATRALWDSWDEDALIIDKASGAYLDSAKVRRVDYRGPYFAAMGPLNAARPPQGHPLLLRDLDEVGESATAADVVLGGLDRLDRLARAPKGAVRLLKVTAASLDDGLHHVRDGLADGLHLMGPDALELLEALRGWVDCPPYVGTTARQRLGLRKPVNPYSRKGAA